MDSFVARQPILNRQRKVVAYELLARSGPENFFVKQDVDKASARVISEASNVFGLDALAQGRRLYVNLTRKVLLDEWICTLPPGRTVVEILETIEPDDEVVQAVARLRTRGYQIALDDFVNRPAMQALVALADVIKVDFRGLSLEERQAVPKELAREGLSFLAEKVETKEEFEEALAHGYSLFQGYWFHKPEMISARDIPPSRWSRLQLLQVLNQEHLDFDELEGVLKSDVSLSVKLLRYLNSAAFGFRERIASIRHALILLGEQPCRRWATLLTVADLSEQRPPVLLISSITRAVFCESLAPRVASKDNPLHFFLAGLLSCLDVLVGRPMEELATQLMLPEVVKATLTGHRESSTGRTLDLAIACEQGQWTRVGELEKALGLTRPTVEQAWRKAVEWADSTVATALKG